MGWTNENEHKRPPRLIQVGSLAWSKNHNIIIVEIRGFSGTCLPKRLRQFLDESVERVEIMTKTWGEAE